MIELLSSIFLMILSILTLAGLALFAHQSLRECEMRAARISLVLAVLCAGLFGSAALAPYGVRVAALILTALLLAASVLAFWWPTKPPQRANETPAHRFDERDILFARARLIPGSREFTQYYTMHPDRLPLDEAWRSLPGLLSPDAPFASPLLFASPEASFFLTGALREAVDGPISPHPVGLPAEKMTGYIRSLASYYGALETGITMLRPYHIYSHVGRGAGEWGAEITLEHRFAIAFTVEMEPSMITAAPGAPTIMESARQYVESARVAVQLAAAIRALGYPARAHIDGNYQVIAPLVARDAGLGEIGRMGLLMTPRHGPRVRLGVVTTDLPLAPDPRRPSAAMLDFCNLCQKCAAACPSAAIPTGDRAEIDQTLRWRINADACFRYWCMVGTDCGRCIAVCPFSHPNHWTHNLVRAGIYRSGLFRRAALRLDDLIYGRKPRVKHPPAWVKVARDARQPIRN